MSQSLTQIYVHIVFSTKNRAAFLGDDEMRQRVHAYLAGTCKNHESPALRIGGVEEHVHILCRLSKTIAISVLVRELKRDSSQWVKATWPALSDFYWQNGYGAFSISPAHVDAVTQYIAGQEEHHRRETFQNEVRRFCREYGVELDERYAWD